MRTVCGGQVRDALVPGALVQGREGQRTAEKLAAENLAAQKLLRKLIRTPSRTPRVMVTDEPGSDGAARTGMGLNAEHRQHMGLNHMGLNNRAKNAHLPTLRRKRIMKWIIKRFTSVRHLKRLDFIHDGVANLYTFPAKPWRHPTIKRCEPRRLWRGARAEPGIAAQREGTAPTEKLLVFTWPPFGKLTGPLELATSCHAKPSGCLISISLRHSPDE